MLYYKVANLASFKVLETYCKFTGIFKLKALDLLP